MECSLGSILINEGSKMKKSIPIINSFLCLVLVTILSGCSFMSEISDSLIELDVSYNEKLNVIENIGDIYCNPIDEQHIVVSECDGVSFLDNEVLIVVTTGTTLNEVEALAEKYGGEVVGCIEKTGDYQLLLNTVNNIDGINSLASKLESEDIVISAYPNYVAVYSEDSINYGNEWKSDLKKPNDCKGKSWGVEAINAPAAWKLLEESSEKVNSNLRVGVIDGGFDLNHEDLGFAERFPNYNKESDDHGTHVAGTFAAISDNNEGICGVYPYGRNNLYGISTNGISGYCENKTSIMVEKIALSELILRNVKVINQSQGFNWSQFDQSNPIDGKSEVINSGKEQFTNWWRDFENSKYANFLSIADLLGDFLNRLLISGYDFVITSSAGNDSYYATEHLESKYNSWLNLIDEEKYPNVFRRIIVVGSVGQNMNISRFSNAGNRVSVYGPGERIFSTLPNNKYSYKKYGWDFLDEFGTWDGTSMAAPHVAGVAAMVWAANSDLTGEMVKLIVCGRTTNKGTGINIVDAQKAVSYALNKDLSERTKNNKTETPSLGSIMSYVVTADLNESSIPGAIAEAVNVETGDKTTVTTDFTGHFALFLPEGRYKIKVSAEKYETYTYENEIVCESSGINYVDWAKLVSKKKYADNFYNKTIGDVISYYGEDSCSEYPLQHGGTGVYVPFLHYVFVSETYDTDLNSKIISIEVLDEGEMFSGAIIGSTAVKAASETHRKFSFDRIEVSDVNGNFIYIDKPSENITYYIELSEKPISDIDTVDNHINTMTLQTGLVMFSYKDSEEQSISSIEKNVYSKQDMYEKLTSECNSEILIFEYDDYDGNSTYEAFAVTVTDNYEYHVYFINEHGEVIYMGKTEYEVYNENMFIKECDHKKFFYFDYGAGGSGWKTMLFSVRNGVPYELKVSRSIQGFYYGNGVFYTTENDFSNGFHEYPPVELIYDKENQQFIRGERINQIDDKVHVNFPENVFEYNGHYYMVYQGVASTFEDAVKYCEGLGGHLVVINDEEENIAVYNYIKSLGIENAYLGYSDFEKEGVWKWYGDESQYTNWHQNEPNSENNYEDYAMFYYKYKDGSWNDGDFGRHTVNGETNFICEWEYDSFSKEQLDLYAEDIANAINKYMEAQSSSDRSTYYLGAVSYKQLIEKYNLTSNYFNTDYMRRNYDSEDMHIEMKLSFSTSNEEIHVYAIYVKLSINNVNKQGEYIA